MSLTERAKEWAIARHEGTNHLYDGQPYAIHLTHVVRVAIQWLHLIPQEAQDEVIAACCLHDTIEDCRVTYNDVKNEFGEKVAELVYALTNLKGRNRKERAGHEYYRGIRDVQYATFVKICDRIANIEHSVNTRSSMLQAYQKEKKDFWLELYMEPYVPMFEYIESIILTTPTL